MSRIITLLVLFALALALSGTTAFEASAATAPTTVKCQPGFTAITGIAGQMCALAVSTNTGAPLATTGTPMSQRPLVKNTDPGTSAIQPYCVQGALLSLTNTVGINWGGPNNDTATAATIGWAFCNEQAQFWYSWNGAQASQTAQSYVASPGENVTVTLYVGSPSNGCCPWVVSASSTAPSSGGPPPPTCPPTCSGGNPTPPSIQSVGSNSPVASGNATLLYIYETGCSNISVSPGGSFNVVDASPHAYNAGNQAIGSYNYSVNCVSSAGLRSNTVTAAVSVVAAPPPTNDVITVGPDGWSSTSFDANGNVTGSASGDSSNQPFTGGRQFLNNIYLPKIGQKTVDWYESGHSTIFNSLVYRFHQVCHWTWNNGVIGSTSCGTYTSNIDTFTEQGGGVIGSVEYWYTWNGNAHGGWYSMRQGKFDNCIVKYGCLSSSYPWVKLYLNGNGAWVGYDGGGAT